MSNVKNYDEEKFDSFLNKTIIFSSKDYFRSQMKVSTKEKTIIDTNDFTDLIQDFNIYNNSFSVLNNTENKIYLSNALKSLSAIEQSVIFLLFNEELSQTEAAKILKICSKSVSRIKLRAITKLRKYLKGGNDNER
ncbi:MAG: sigma-70 family RNA polymerase sigma factor [Clostridia bacterium]|nr:sigma-70 family RNA polymerase sigma factor [Clostridia bacterium]